MFPIKARVGDIGETSKKQPPLPLGLPPKQLTQNTQTRIAWLLLEDESTRQRRGEERSASLLLQTVSNYLMSHSHV